MAKQDLAFQTISQRLHQLTLPEVDLVLGIGRGGVVPATMVAHQLCCKLHIIQVNYRNDDNQPIYDVPRTLDFSADLATYAGRVLLVDDVSVTGRTLAHVKALLPQAAVTTLVFKGKADYVLFPEIAACVNWPWKMAQEVALPPSVG